MPSSHEVNTLIGFDACSSGVHVLPKPLFFDAYSGIKLITGLHRCSSIPSLPKTPAFVELQEDILSDTSKHLFCTMNIEKTGGSRRSNFAVLVPILELFSDIQAVLVAVTD